MDRHHRRHHGGDGEQGGDERPPADNAIQEERDPEPKGENPEQHRVRGHAGMVAPGDWR